MKRFVKGGWDRCEKVVDGHVFRTDSIIKKENLRVGILWGNAYMHYGDLVVGAVGDGKISIGMVYVLEDGDWKCVWMGNKIFDDLGHAMRDAMDWCDNH